MTNLRAIIFDFDGVITESMGIKEKAFIFLFKNYPEYAEKIRALHRAHGGMSRFEKFKIIYHDIFKLPYDEKMGEKLSDTFSKFVHQEIIKCPYVKGAKEFLEEYHKKFSLFIASGTPEKEMRDIARERGIARYFMEIFGAPASKAEICKRILQKYHLRPEQVLMVGDSIDDYEGAKEACIGFIGRITDKNPFSTVTTRAIIHDISELEKYL